jgi:uncharacterized protein YfdQ (DUF2303 family)
MTNTNTLKNDTVREIAELGAQAAGIDFVTITTPETLKGVAPEVTIGIKHGKEPQLIDVSPFLEKYRHTPAFKSGTATTLTLDSFIDLTNRHRTEHSVVFAELDVSKPRLEAVIDYHRINNPETPEGNIGVGNPDNLKHRILYKFPLSDEWKNWQENNNKTFSQKEFATFIQDNIVELSTPTDEEKKHFEKLFASTIATPVELIKLSSSLQVNVDSKVINSIRLESGEGQIKFEEAHLGADGKPLKVPGLFMINIPIFVDSEPVRICAHLRYRVNGGAVSWSYKLHRADQVIQDRIKRDAILASSSTSIPVYFGSPEA